MSKLKRVFKIVGWSILGILLLCISAMGFTFYKAKYGINFYETEPADLPEDMSGNTVLLFSKTNGWHHGEAIETSIPAFERMAMDNGWTLFITEEGGVFNPDQLKMFDVVIWNNTSGKVLNEEQREIFKDYLLNGGGFVGIHAAGDDSHQWNWYEKEVIGAGFSHHTMNPQIQTANMHLEEGPETLTKGMMDVWEREEEWYMFYQNPRDNGFDILYTVDESNMIPGGNIPILASDKDWGMGEDHPIVWFRELGQGRAFYSALGHQGSAFEEMQYLRLLENAIKWAGDFDQE